MARTLAERISLGAGGSVEVDVVITAPGGESSLLEQLVGGALDIALVDDWVIAETSQPLRFLSLPFLFATEDGANAFFTGPTAESVARTAGMQDIEILGWIKCEPPVLVSKGTIGENGVFTGLRVAAPANPVLRDAMTGLGAAVVPMTDEEKWASFAAGNVDAVLATLTETEIHRPSGPGSVFYLPMYYPFLAVCWSPAAITAVKGTDAEALGEVIRPEIEKATQENVEGSRAAESILSANGYEMSLIDRDMLQMNQGESRQIMSTSDKGLVDKVEELNRPVFVQ